jgi:DNA-binding CsgD family transcriptional regulator
MHHLIIAFTAILSVFSVFGKPNLSLNNINDDFRYELSYLKIHDEFKGNQVINSEFLKFPESKSFGINNGTYWIKLKLQPSTISRDLIAYIPTHNISEIGVYQLNEEQLELKTQTGNGFIQTNNEFHYNFPYFDLFHKKDEDLTYYLKVSFKKQANFPLNILTEKEFHHHVFKVSSYNIYFYGICSIIIIFNLLLFLKIKERFIIYYTLFLTALLLKFQLFHGLFINIFGGSLFYDFLEVFLNCTLGIVFLFFSIYYLEIHRLYPKLKNKLLLFPASMVLLYLIYFLSGNSILLLLAELVGLVIFPVIWILSFVILKKKKSAKFYLLGFTLIVPLSIFFILGYNLGFWEVRGDMLIGKIASLLNILVFSYSIVYRINYSKNDANRRIELRKKAISLQDYSNMKSTSATPFLSLLKENEYSNSPLTVREVDILDCLTKGLNNNEISEKLFISPSTVKTHIRNLYLKFNVGNKKDLKIKLSFLFY